MLTRLAQCVLILDAHEDMESEIYRAGGAREIATHNRTLYIAGARHARGTRYRIAFNQSPKSPTFDEIGIIAGAVKKNFRSKGNREDERKDLQ
jgi:hypothetical protein